MRVEVLNRSSDEHVLHEKSMVRPSRDNSDVKSVPVIPSSIPINNKKSRSDVKEVYSSSSIPLISLGADGNIHFTPPNGIFSDLILDNSLVIWTSPSSLA